MPTLTKHLPKSRIGKELVGVGAAFLGRRGPLDGDFIEYFTATREQAGGVPAPAMPNCDDGTFALTVESKVIDFTDARGRKQKKVEERKNCVGKRFHSKLLEFLETDEADGPLKPLDSLLRNPEIPEKDPALHGRRNAD